MAHRLLPLYHGNGGTVRFESDENDPWTPPPFNAHELARDVFSNSFFYGSQKWADNSKERREEVLQNMTVGDVHYKYVLEYPWGKERGMGDFAGLIGAFHGIRAFLDLDYERIEETLALKRFISLTEYQEVRRYRDHRVDNLPIADSIWSTTCARPNSRGEKSRALPLCLVLGPSGSGKTCFALEYLRDEFFNPEKKKVVTIYLHAGETGIKFIPKDSSVAEQLIDWIRKKVKKESVGPNVPNKIDMHVCLVLDEAGSSHCKAWFEDRDMLTSLCKEAKKLATSVIVAVVGSGLTGRELSSTNDAYIFRMRPWGADDLAKALMNWKYYLRLADQETLHTVADAIFEHPKLSALATNGRSAYLLGRVVANLSSRYPPLSWDLQLNEWTEAIVMQVVDGYGSLNGINNLKHNERRRVAGSIFRALQKLKEGDANLPTFSELEEREIQVAESLLQNNLEGGDQDLQLLPDEDFAFTVTPAIVLILFSMSGVYTTFWPGWESQEELAVHHAVRQCVLNCMEAFVSDLNGGLDRKASQNKLDESLARIRVVRLQEKLESNYKNVLVPLVDGGTIMMNHDMASFANVIAPNTLIQAKHTKQPSERFDVNLFKEVKKCGLVKEDDSDTRLLRGLITIWQNQINMNSMNSPNAATQLSPTATTVKVQRNPQCSKAYPDNLLSLAPSKDPIRYAVIEGKPATAMTIDNGETKIPLPVLDGITITFILSTNAERLNLNLGPSLPKVTITEENVDDDMKMNVETLNDSDKDAWTQFVNNRLREGVQIKFLFTS